MRQREEKEKTVRWRDEKNRDMDFPYVWRKKEVGEITKIWGIVYHMARYICQCDSELLLLFCLLKIGFNREKATFLLLSNHVSSKWKYCTL